MVQRILICLMVFCLLLTGISGCSREKHKDSTKLQVVATLFPLYDFARIIAGDRAEVSMLLPPGMEPHSFEPRPNDIVRISSAGLFIYTSRYMEPWAASIIKGIDNRKLQVVDSGQGISFLTVTHDDEHDAHGGHHESGGREAFDPHIWLDFANAGVIVNNILAGFVAADPQHAAAYRGNAERLKTRLAELDQRYRVALSSCESRVFLHGGHYTFGYLARRYGLVYRSLSGISSESEPSAARMAAMVRQIRSSGVRYLFAEQMLSPRLAETLANEAGVSILRLHGGHNLGRDDLLRGMDFIALMDNNLTTLQKGLACRPK